MKKLSLTMQRMAVAMLLMALSVPFGIDALAGAMPEITSYYPGKRDENPMELKKGTKAYIYLTAGSKAVSAKANLVQNGQQLGTVVYTGAAAGAATLTMEPGNADNSALQLIEPGLFSFEFFEMSYYDEGELTTVSGDVFASVTYKRAMAGAQIVSSVNLAGQTMYSYYPADSEDGVVSFTFDKAVVADRPVAYLEYGQGNQYYTTRVDISVSDDGKSITVDLRGKCYNQNVLAPGVVFVDESGNPIDPPTAISLSIERLDCVDGTQVVSKSVSLDGQHSMDLEGRIYCTYNYVDLTFPNPTLVKADFYSSATPAVRYGTMQDDSDMIDLYIDNASSMVKADVAIKVSGAEALVAFDQVKVGHDVYTFAIPAAIKAAGADGMVISLENVEYEVFDGSEHVIAPLRFDELNPEVNSIAQLKDLAADTEVVLNLYDAMLVTLANDQGYMFAEDATAGIQLITADYTQAFNQGDLVSGRIVGQYMGYGLLLIDKEASDLSIAQGDASTGYQVADVMEVMGGDYDCRLLTIVSGDDMPIEYDEDAEILMIGGLLPVMTDFAGGFSLAEGMKVDSVTGVLYRDPSLGQPMLLIRELADIVESHTDGIRGIDADGAAQKVYDIKGINHDGRSLAPGLYIINGKKTLIK